VKNPGLQAISLILAVLLWGFVRVTQEGIGTTTRSQLTVEVPIRLKGTPSGRIPYDITPGKVHITVRGDSGSISQLKEDFITASVDLSRAESAATVWAEVKPLAPGGLTIVSVEPPSVNIKLSASASRLVPVHLRVSGKPAAGMSVGEPSIDPTQVRLSGPEDLLNEVQVVIGQCVLDGQERSYSLQVRDLTPVNSQGTEVQGTLAGIKLMPDAVTATIPVQPNLRTVSVPVGLDNVRTPSVTGWRFRVEAEPPAVTLQLPPAQTPPVSVSVRPLTFTGIKAQAREAAVDVPAGTTVVGNATVRVKLVSERLKARPSPAP
jgi:YbbR domain-containing protein